METAFAATIETTNINNITLNQKLQELSLLQGKKSTATTKALMRNVTDSILTHLTPKIENLTGFDIYNPFIFNCTVLFDTKLDKTICDLDFDPEDELMDKADPGGLILRKNLDKIEDHNILVIRAYVDLSSDKHIQGANYLYFKYKCKSSQTLEETESLTDTTVTIKSITLTVERSETVTKDSRSATDDTTKSITPTVVTSNTASAPNSKTSSELFTPSLSATATKTSVLCIEGCARTVAIKMGPGQGSGLGSQQVPALNWELGGMNSTLMNWSDAKNYCANKGNGWRLPTIWEVYVLYRQKEVLGGNLGLGIFWLWSSTPVSGGTNVVWGIFFSNSVISNNLEVSQPHRVLCCVPVG